MSLMFSRCCGSLCQQPNMRSYTSLGHRRGLSRTRPWVMHSMTCRKTGNPKWARGGIDLVHAAISAIEKQIRIIAPWLTERHFYSQRLSMLSDWWHMSPLLNFDNYGMCLNWHNSIQQPSGHKMAHKKGGSKSSWKKKSHSDHSISPFC